MWFLKELWVELNLVINWKNINKKIVVLSLGTKTNST